MKTFAIFVVLLAITVAMELKESPPIQNEDPRLIGSLGFMGLQPPKSTPSVVGTGGLGGFQLPPQFLVPERKPSLRSRSGTDFCNFHVIQLFLLKSFHFKKTVAQSSFLSKALSFLLALF